MDIGRFMKLWVLGSLAVVAVAVMWAFAPILVFLALVTGGCGVIAGLAIAAARAIERRRGRPPSGGES